MGNRIQGIALEPGSVPSSALSAQALADIRASKLIALRDLVEGVLFPASDSMDVTTQVEATAVTDVPTTGFTIKGIFVGSVSGPTDSHRVIVKEAGKDNGINDGLNDDVYGVLSESSGVYTLSLKKSDGSAFSFASPTSIDFYFVEIFDGEDLPTDHYLKLADARGAIDKQAQTKADSAQAQADLAIARIGDVSGATPANYTPTAATVRGHLDGVDAALAAAGLAKRLVRAATVTALPAVVYNNGTAGVGATLTASANGALVLDGITLGLNDRVAVMHQALAFQNGIYAVQDTGS